MFLIGCLALHTALWLDDWHTTQLYDYTTGTPHSFMARRLAHHTALWLDDWHATIALWLDKWHVTKLTGCVVCLSVLCPNARNASHLLAWMIDTTCSSPVETDTYPSLWVHNGRQFVWPFDLLTMTTAWPTGTVICWRWITDLLLNLHYFVNSLELFTYRNY